MILLKKQGNLKKQILKDLVQIADVISIHAHVNNQTKYMINKKNSKICKKKTCYY